MSAKLSRGLAGVLLAFALTATARADDAKDAVPRKELDARIHNALRDAITAGAKMFNDGDEDGCYRLYQGALMGTVPLLDHRPPLKKSAEDKLAKAQQIRSSADRAFALRDVIDEIRAAIRKDGPAASTRPLWDRLGGEPAVKKVVHEFVAASAPDPKVDFTRGGKFKLDEPMLEKRLVELVSAVTGGPLKYTGRNMKEVHVGMKITDDEFNALAGHLVATLKKNNVAPREIDELVTIVNSTRGDIVEVKSKTLWERLGGERGVRAVVQEFLTTAGKDPKVNVDRNGNYPLTKERAARVEQLVVEFISSGTGGPLKYTGRDMKNTHLGMKITEAEFDAAGKHLVDALTKLKVAKKEIDELVAIVISIKKDTVEK